MHRLANFDVSRSFKRPAARLAAKLLFGFACGLAMIGLRSAIDIIAPTAGPFALVYPAVLLATLYGHWQGGAVAFVTTFAWAWYVVLPPAYSFEFAVASDASRVAINVLSVIVAILFAETFRRAVRTAADQRDREIEHRHLLLAEIEHRTKNNFALVVSLLELQKRSERTPEATAAIEQAIGRVNSFAGAYANLGNRQGEGASVAMLPYMAQLVDMFRTAGFRHNVSVVLDCSECDLPRETAVAIGLFTNEALTNCAKHAFPDGRSGSIAVTLHIDGEAWSLTIADDGIGDAAQAGAPAGSGLGTRLYEAFASQARARYAFAATPSGRTVSLASA